MRAIIDIEAAQDQALKRLARLRGVSRAQLVQSAIGQLLHDAPRGGPTEAFGIWRGRKLDGLTEERRLRGEWPS